MYKLLTINGVSLPEAEGDFTISQNEKYNEYEGEDGSSTIEVVRQGIISLSVSFDVLSEEMLKRITGAINIVSELSLYNPMTRKIENKTVKITGVKTKRVKYRNGASLWSLSFDINEL